MPIDTPAALVDEFKKTGEFERLRRELLAQFQQDESYPSFKEGIERIARKRMTNDQSMHFQTVASALHELTQEVQRYPIVERAVANVQPSPPILTSMQQTMRKILHDEKNPGSALTTPKDVKNGTTIRTEATQTTETQPKKAMQDAQVEGETKAAEHSSSTPVVTAVSESLNSQAPAETPTNTADNLEVTSQSKPSSEETNIPVIAPPESKAMDSEPSSSAISAEKSNANMAVDDQPETTTTDIEMEDVQSTHQARS